MKCKACHHLNVASEAQCFMCGEKLYRGAPKAHGVVFVFVALCIFIPVFSTSGAATQLLPIAGIPTKALRSGGGPGIVPLIIGCLGVSVCLAVSRTHLTSQVQSIACGVITAFCWLVFLIYFFSYAKEMHTAKQRFVHRSTLPKPIDWKSDHDVG